MVTYYFESEKEWEEKIFSFSLDDMMDKLECEYISHKNIEFEAKNREKLSFKFKPDSNISVDSVNLYFDGQYNKIMKVVKYYLKNKQLDVDIIFNKKGRYKIVIYFYDNSSSKNTLLDFNDLTYYAIVKSDAKEYKEFSDEEIIVNQPFEDSLTKFKLKYISHKNQNVVAKRIEKFELECEDKEITISIDNYPRKAKLIKKQKQENNKHIFYFGFNEIGRFIIQFKLKNKRMEFTDIIYKIDYNGEIDKPLLSPEIYNDDITLIEPIFTQLQFGKKTTLKFKSDVTDEIIVSNNEYIHVKKNEVGIFEITLIPKIYKIYIMKPKDKPDLDYSTSIILNVI